jgi:putative hemolysin
MRYSFEKEEPMEQHHDPLAAVGSTLSVSLAKSHEDVRAAQRLRYEVFALECGAILSSHEEGIDRDEFDDYCDHLIVRDQTTNEVVGTYRILTSWKAKDCGAFYSESEFDLRNVMPLVPRLVEVGRTCIRREYRQGSVITLLWSGLAQYMITRGYEYLMGCASIQLDDTGITASATYLSLQKQCLSPDLWRVYPRNPFPITATDPLHMAALPPLVKGYVRLGAYVCGEPAWDRQFNSADLLMLLPLSRMNPRYARHFLGRSCQSESSAA